jgi:hypothetical protein
MNHYHADENWEILEHDWMWKIHVLTQKTINESISKKSIRSTMRTNLQKTLDQLIFSKFY